MKNNVLFKTIDELLPHRGQMVLITDVIDWGEDWLEAIVDHRQPSILKTANGTVPSWIGIEYMSQTIGALIGVRAMQAGKPIRIGFLMGTQKYESSAPFFKQDSILTVKVTEILSDKTSLAVFDCSIMSDEFVANAQIKAIMPSDPASVLRGV